MGLIDRQKSTMPIIGIVVPAFNCAAYIRETIESISEQTVRCWQCTIVDDGSTDETASIIAQAVELDSRFKLIRLPNAGQCLARNRGYAELSRDCKFVTFMDADDVWEPDALQSLMTELEDHPEAVGAHGLGEFIDEKGQPIYPGAFSALGRSRVDCTGGWPTPWPLDRPTTFATIVTASVVFPPGLILTRREIYQKAGLFDAKMRYAEDWDLLIRLARYGDFRFINRVVLHYRRHNANTGTKPIVAEMCGRVRYKAFNSPQNSDSHRKVVRESWRAAQIVVARARISEAREALLRGRFVCSGLLLGRLLVIGYRYVRGYPAMRR
jgi:glycosyltransferase involved in cell wall biosynthesis